VQERTKSFAQFVRSAALCRCQTRLNVVVVSPSASSIEARGRRALAVRLTLFPPHINPSRGPVMNSVELAAGGLRSMQWRARVGLFPADRPPRARSRRRQGCLLPDLGRLRGVEHIHRGVRARRRHRLEHGSGLRRQCCLLPGNGSSDLLEARRCSVRLPKLQRQRVSAMTLTSMATCISCHQARQAKA
jgi:hypothetical protein